MSAPMNQPLEQPPVPAQILQIIMNFWGSRAVYVFARLGIPDLLKSGPKTVDELASATNMHAPSLYRVLRALSSIGFVSATADGRFAQTPLSEILVTDAPGSLRWFTISELGQEHYPAWGNLMHSVKTGEIAFDNFFGVDIWKYFEQNPEDGAVFNNSMSGVTKAINEEIRSLYDFSSFGTVVDIGGGTTEVAITSLGGLVVAESVRVGGYEMDEAIVRHVKTSHRLLVGGEEAEVVKIRIGSAWPLADDETAELRGRDLVTGLLRRTVIAADEVRHALTLPLERIVEAVRTTLERAPAELSADVMQRGLMLVGGGALLRGIDRRLQAETGLAVTIAEEPLTRVAVGAGRSLEEPRLHAGFAKGRAGRRRAGPTR